ncbi:hypothetical protein KOW79_022533 [Hemibagrus wyckioides]|uniref:Uncharacterized protein n=1 Tax=Hemibagrus wyckioides TaxID=337641 RepID=A0A9D3N1D2_9TELE|nr:hypothetical protein KOW79_022533 [Hemibagrus wyckioides]
MQRESDTRLAPVDFEVAGPSSDGQREEAGPSQSEAVLQGADKETDLVESLRHPDGGRRAAEEPLNPLQGEEDTRASEVEGRHLDETHPTEAVEPNTQQSAWMPVSWTEGLEATHSPAPPNWASMDFSDGLEQGILDQELEEEGAGPLDGGRTRSADGVSEERNPKRSCQERRREFDLLGI